MFHTMEIAANGTVRPAVLVGSEQGIVKAGIPDAGGSGIGDGTFSEIDYSATEIEKATPQSSLSVSSCRPSGQLFHPEDAAAART